MVNAQQILVMILQERTISTKKHWPFCIGRRASAFLLLPLLRGYHFLAVQTLIVSDKNAYYTPLFLDWAGAISMS